MTVYTVEVRASTEQYDILGSQVAHDILQLPGSSGHTGPLHQPLAVRTAQLYHLTGTLSPSQLDQLTYNLLIDPVTQVAIVSSSIGWKGDQGEGNLSDRPKMDRSDDNQGGDKPRPYPITDHYQDDALVVDVFFHAGVTDTLAESVLMGALMVGIEGIERVETGQRYYFDGRLSEGDVRSITEGLLYNPVIQHYQLYPVGTRFIASAIASDRDAGVTDAIMSFDEQRGEETVWRGGQAQGPHPVPPFPLSLQDVVPQAALPLAVLGEDSYNRVPTYIPITSMSDEQLLELSKTGLLALNREEMRAIQRHFRGEGREPSDVEMETLAQTWSEHCSHKTFKAVIEYREMDVEGRVLAQESIKGLLKSYIMSATWEVGRPWVVSAFSDNAGIVCFTEMQDIAFKVETHNHPSAIEPFGGANTGVGGVIRDVLGVSAQPIACTDILCFGPPDTSSKELPKGVLAPRRIASGVVNGVRDYGNKMGIPTVNGAVLYHGGYIFNPLVFCGCLGILPHGSHPRRVQPGDRIVVLGGRTGRDGIHGATFSSGEMSSEINAQAGSAVQIGAPITEKKVADVVIQARDRRLYSAITDCGAGGFSSAIGEMGADTGAYVELEKAPLKYQGLAPWEIWLSEAQERMVLAVPPEHLEDLLEICAIEEVEASIIGTFTDSHRLVVGYAGQIVADLPMSFLHDGRPERTLRAVWVDESNNNVRGKSAVPAGATDFPRTLLHLLRHPTIASKESVVRRYDHEVQGATVLKPLVGRAGNGPGDAAILQPILDEQSSAGIVLSNGVNPLYGQLDPYWMAMNVVDEALRNLTAVGGDIERAAILDNFCWGNPTDPEQLGMLVRAVKGCHDAAVGFGVPFISGKDSLNNEYRADGQRLPVIPTLLISALGVIDDAGRSVDMSLKRAGNLLYVVGKTYNELAGSHYVEIALLDEGVAGADPGSVHFSPGIDPLSVILSEAKNPGGQRGILRFAQNDRRRGLGFDTTVPCVDTVKARATMNAVGKAIRAGLVESCHDLSEGGLAVGVAEMALAGLLGVSIDLEQVPHEAIEYGGDVLATVLLFSESASRFLVEVASERREAFERHMRVHGVDEVGCLGRVLESGRFEVRAGERVLIDLAVEELQAAWKGATA